jgi:type IV pilus assembly protein PilX
MSPPYGRPKEGSLPLGGTARSAKGAPVTALPRHPRSPRRPARGFSMLFILLMMVVVGFLALAGMSTGIVQERMAGNARDQNVALQAAEAALRDAEADIQANLDANSGFSTACATGLCTPPSMAASGAQSAPLWQTIDWSTQARAYGSRTAAPALLGPNNQALSAQPRYFVEMLPSLPAAAGGSACLGCTTTATDRARAYRITVRASGVRDTTVVMLQSVYIKQ